jgi:hypothetical protein
MCGARVPQYDVELRLAAEACAAYQKENNTVRELLHVIHGEVSAITDGWLECQPFGIRMVVKKVRALSRSPNNQADR